MSSINRRTFLAGSALAAAGLMTHQRAEAQATTPSTDRRDDPTYVENAIKQISDADLFAALDLAKTDLHAVRDAVASKDYPAAYRAWGDYWQTVGPARGRFLGDGDLLMSRDEAISSLTPRKQQIVAAANTLVAHKINGWGKVTIQHGPVVDFNADYGKNGKYGFNYWGGWSTSLIQANQLTGDAKYLDAFEELFNQWYEQRNHIHGEIPELDVVYYELGLGLRCRPFLQFYCSAKPQAATHEHMLKAMLGNARWLYEEEKRQYRGGNWQIMGSFGLAWIGAMLSEFSDADQWVRMGSERISQHVDADFFPDGCHSERVPSSYMLVAYRDPRNLAALLIDRAKYTDISRRIQPKLARILEWYFAMLPPDGIIPAINDGGRSGFPQALARDARDLFKIPSTTRPDSVSFPASGFTAMRTDASKDALYMLINHGPGGGGHSHADSLDFQLHAYGQAMAVDSGIGYTYDDPNQKPWYVRTRAHNTITVDGDDLNRKEAEGKDVVWATLKGFDFFAATHNGYVASKGITHRRQIAFVKPFYWIVYDVIDSTSDQAHTVSWNLHCTTSLLGVHKSHDWTRGESKGPACVRGIRGFEGKDYADIPWLWFERSIAPGERATLGVLLYPQKSEQTKVELSVVNQTHDAAHFRVQHPDGTDDVLFGAIKSGDIDFNGSAAILRNTRYATAKTLTLKVGGKTIVDSPTPRDDEGNF